MAVELGQRRLPIANQKLDHRWAFQLPRKAALRFQSPRPIECKATRNGELVNDYLSPWSHTRNHRRIDIQAQRPLCPRRPDQSTQPSVGIGWVRVLCLLGPPPCLRCLAGNLRSLCLRQLFGPSFPSLGPPESPKSDRRRVFLFRRWGILSRSRGDVHDELSQLIWIAGAFAWSLMHKANVTRSEAIVTPSAPEFACMMISKCVTTDERDAVGHAGVRVGLSRSMRRRMSAKRSLGMATSAIWKMT